MTKDDRLEILAKNIDVFRKRENVSQEERRLTLSMTAELLCSDESSSLEEIAALYRDLVSDLSGGEEILLYEKMRLSTHLVRKLKEALARGNTNSVPAGSHGRIACVKNPVNLQALELFAQTHAHLKTEFATSFNDACERVADGACEFCVLPIENGVDGKMLTFYSMIDRYELKILSVADIEDERYERVRYALLGRSCREIGERSASLEFLLEFSITNKNGKFIERILSAADACDAKLISISSVPVQYDSNLNKYLFCFSILGNKLLNMLGFLTVNYPNHTTIGFYTSISK